MLVFFRHFLMQVLPNHTQLHAHTYTHVHTHIHTHAHTHLTAARISAMVNAMLLLRSTLKSLPTLHESLGAAESVLLKAVHKTCGEEALTEMLSRIDEVGIQGSRCTQQSVSSIK